MRALRPTTHFRSDKRRTGRMVTTVLVAVAMSASACAASDGDASGDGAIKLGVVVAETGPIAGAGKTFANGGKIAEQMVNDGDLIGGGKTIELVTKEGSEDPAKSASVMAQLGADQSIVGVACCILSTVAGAAEPVAEKQKLPLMLWGATDVGLANPPYVYRTVTMPQPANETLAKQVAEEQKLETVAYGVMTDNSGIVSQGEAFKKGMDEAGVEDLGQVGTLSTQTDFTSSATDLIQKGSDAIVVVGTQSNAVGLIAALHDKGYDGQILSGQTISGTGVYESQPEALEDVPFPVYFLASEATGMGKDFADAYKKEYGEEPDDYAAQGFNAIYTLAMGLKAAGDDTTREGLSKALEEMTELDTIYGPVTFSDGQLEASDAVNVVHYTAPDGVIAPWSPAP